MRRAIENILLVDDEDDHHFITRVTLKKAGFLGRLDAYHTAEDALRHLRAGSEPPDLILVGSSRVDLQACKLEYSIVSPK